MNYNSYESYLNYYDSDIISREADINCKKISIIYDDINMFDALIEKLLQFKKLETVHICSIYGNIEIQDSIRKLKHIKSLHLIRFSSIQNIPESIFELSNLEELHINGFNKISNIPESIGNLRNLKKLSFKTIYDNGTFENVTKLPENLGKLNKLEEFHIEGFNKISNIPESIGNLIYLKEIRLIKLPNLISLHKNFWHLPNLETLELNSLKKIKVFPDEIYKLKGLKTLRLKSLIIVELPSGIEKLTNLEKLEIISLTKLVNLPNELGNLKNLYYLNLENLSNIKNIFSSIGKLNKLKTLKIHILKQLKNIPNVLHQLKSLEELSITKCTNLENIDFIDGLNDKLLHGWIEESLSSLEVIPFKGKKYLHKTNHLLKIYTLSVSDSELYEEISNGSNKRFREKCLRDFNERIKNNGKIAINKNSKIFLNGKSLFSQNEIKQKFSKFHLQIVNKLSDADYIFIGDKPKLSFEELEYKKLVFQDDLELFFSQNHEHYLKQSNGIDINVLKEFLLAQNIKSYKIAIEMMKHEGIPVEIKQWLIIRYFLMDISSNKKSLAEVLKLKFPDLSKIDLFKKNLNNIEKIIINLKEILSDTKDINIESIIIEVLENRQMDMMDFENKRKIIENKNTLNVFHGTGSLKKIFSEELLFLNNSINNLSLFNVKTNLLPDNLYKFTNLEKIIINFAGYKDIVGKNPLGLSKKDLHKFSDFIHLKEIHLNYEILNNDKRTEEAINNNEKQISVSRGLAKSDLKPFLKKGCLLIVNGKKI